MYSIQKLKDACSKAINNILYEGTTDVDLFNTPFEIEYLKDANVRNDLINKICSSIMDAANEDDIGKLGVHKIGHVLVPKKGLADYRKCAWIEVYDEIVYLTLVICIANPIEKMRINKSKKNVHSYRYKYQDNGNIFDTNYNYTSFRNTTRRNRNKIKYSVLAQTDIANFYDRINIHRIISILYANNKIDQDIVHLIDELLRFWANRDSFGLPVGSNASRILAEAALTEVDNYLISQKIEFCRFVDDFRIFSEDAFSAQNSLEKLTYCLNREGLFVNSSKTNIIDISSENNQNITNENDNFHHEEGQTFETARIIRGYTGLIPTKFRKLTQHQIEVLSENDSDELLKIARNKTILKETEITTLIKTIIAKKEYSKLDKIPQILKKYPRFIPYFIDVLIKHSNLIPENSREAIKKSFKKWLNDKNTPEYIEVYLVRLYSTQAFEWHEILLDAFRNLKRNSGDYIGRALLESIENNITRGEMLEIRDYYYRADNWEKRQILKMLYVLHGDEARPFMKDISIHNEDFFVSCIISGYKKKKKSKKA